MLQDINNFLHTLNSEDGAHKNTILSYKYDINQFRDFLIKKKITFTKIKKIDVLNFLEYLKLKKVMNKTKARKIYALKRFYKFLLSEKLISSNPLDKIDIPKSEETLSITLSIEQINKILNTVSKNIDNYKKLRW